MRFCITGASSGLGREMARACVHAGHEVFVLARRKELLESLAAELGERCTWMAADITQEADVLRWTQEMERRGFIPDVLVLNASVQLADMATEGPDNSAAVKTLDVNLAAQFRSIAAIVPAMLTRGSGTVLAIASTAMLRPSAISASYSASKAGIALAMRSLDLRYRSKGLRFRTVCLGPIATEMWEGRRSRLVPPPARAAEAILRFVQSGRSILYYPFLTTWLLRLSVWLPDRVFAFVSGKVMK